MIGLSVDYAIHLTHRFHERVKEGSKDPVESTVVGVGSALFASVLTTIAGFLALLLGVSPNSKIQGMVLAIGVAYAFIISILILPPLMVLQRKFMYSKLDEIIFQIKGRKEKTKKSFVDKFLSTLASFQVKRPWSVLIFVVVMTVLIVPGFSLVYLDTDDENWVPDNDPVIRSLEEVGHNFGGTESTNLLFSVNTAVADFDPDAVTDLRDPRFLEPLSVLDVLYEDLTWVDSVDSPSNTLKSLNDERIPKDIEEIKKIINQPGGDYNEDYSIARLTVRADYINRGEYYSMMRELDGVNFPEEIQITPQGPVPEDIEFEQTMGADAMKTTGIGFILVILVASLFYRSIKAGLLAFIPIIMAIVWTVGIMGYINLPFTVLTTGMLAILMGMGIDFAIHIIHSVRESMVEYENELTQAIPHALMSTGQAISITTITTVLGFTALSFATLVNTQRLGWTLALGILMTFFACILIVPAVLSLSYRTRGVTK